MKLRPPHTSPMKEGEPYCWSCQRPAVECPYYPTGHPWIPSKVTEARSLVWTVEEIEEIKRQQNQFAALYPRSAELQQLRNKHLPTQIEYFSKVELDPGVYGELQFKDSDYFQNKIRKLMHVDLIEPGPQHLAIEETGMLDRAKTVVADLSKSDQQALYEFMHASLGCRIYER